MISKVLSEIDEMVHGDNTYGLTEDHNPFLLAMLVAELKQINHFMEGLVQK